ncbi:MAG: DNA helicase-2/ATP-dependent DNA helicase PcrA [Lentimonas sp.]
MKNLNLNQVQKDAVVHQGSPLLILAGAGTGKTRVLTERIIYLINTYLANPQQILAVTFTNKAASEMKFRISNQIGELAHNIWMGTFHGVAMKILKRHPETVGLKGDFTILDSDDSLRLIKQITTDFNIDNKEFPAKNYQHQIERLKDKALLPTDFSSSPEVANHLPKFLAVYQSYQSRLIALNCADFGDLLLYNLKIFEKSPDILQYYQNKFQQILVDEYQDTNKCQYRWLLALAGNNPNICAVGDDDQSIYSWRGAEIANILRFEKDFKQTRIIRLEQNYRSSSNILDAASHLIKNNQHRHGKTLWTEKKDDSNEKVKLTNYVSDRAEADGIANNIFSLKGRVNLNQVAILVRAGYQTRSFEEVFMSQALPYRIIGGLKFYDRREIKDATSYLRIVQNLSDDLALERIINLPKRGLGKVGLDKLRTRARDEKSSLFMAVKRSVLEGSLKGKIKQSLLELVENLEKWQNLMSNVSLTDLTQAVLEDSGYVKMWQNENTPDAKTRVENLNEFIGGLSEFENLAHFLDHISLVSGNDKIDQSQEEMVNIMTVHGAKGLEFDCVFIPGLEEGVFPSGRAAAEKNGLEEERRLLYVAITRARKLLYLSYAQSRFVFGQMQYSLPSPFLRELPDDIVNESQSSGGDYYFNAKQEKDGNDEKKGDVLWQRVFHQKFGYGKVLEVDGDKLKIKFEKAGTKTIIKDFVTF